MYVHEKAPLELSSLVCTGGKTLLIREISRVPRFRRVGKLKFTELPSSLPLLPLVLMYLSIPVYNLVNRTAENLEPIASEDD
jgi:hypothetical protein